MTKKKLVFYWNTTWLLYTLDYRGKCPLNHYTIVQLALFCQWSGKWDEIPYVQAFSMSLHNKDLTKKGNKLNMHRRELASKPLPDIKTQEELKNEISLFNSLNPGDPRLAARRFPLPPPLLLDTLEIGSRYKSK